MFPVRANGLRDTARKQVIDLYETKRHQFENDGFRVQDELLSSILEKEILIAVSHEPHDGADYEQDLQSELEQVKADRAAETRKFVHALEREFERNKQLELQLKDLKDRYESVDEFGRTEHAEILVKSLTKFEAQSFVTAESMIGSKRPQSAQPKKSRRELPIAGRPVVTRKFRRPMSAGEIPRSRVLSEQELLDPNGSSMSLVSGKFPSSRPASASAGSRPTSATASRSKPPGRISPETSTSSIKLSSRQHPLSPLAESQRLQTSDQLIAIEHLVDQAPCIDAHRWLDFFHGMTHARQLDRLHSMRNRQVATYQKDKRRHQVETAIKTLWTGVGTTNDFVDTVDSMSPDFRHDYLVEVALQVKQLGQLVELLNSIHTMTTSSLDLEELCEVFTKEALRILHAREARLFLVDERLGSMRLWGEPKPEAISLEEGIAGFVARNQKLINVPFPAVQCNSFSLKLDRLPRDRSNAIICAPVMFDGTVLAVIELFNKQGTNPEHSFSHADAHMLQMLCNETGVLFRRCFYHKQALDISDRTLSLMTLTQHYPSEPDDTFDLMYNCFQFAMSVLHARHIRLFMCSKDVEDRPYLWFKVPSESAGKGRLRVEITEGIVGAVARDRWLINQDDYQDVVLNQHEGRTAKPGTVLCAAIVKSSGALIGVVQVLDKNGGVPFNKADEAFLSLYCRQVAIGVEHGVVESAVARSKFIPSETLSQAIDRARLLLQAEKVLMFEVDRKSGQAICTSESRDVQLAISSGGLIGYVARSGITLTVADCYSDPRWDARMDQVLETTTHSMLAAAIFDKSDTVIGVLCITNKKEDAKLASFTHIDEAMARVLAKQIASIITANKSRVNIVSNKKNLARRVSTSFDSTSYESQSTGTPRPF